MSENAEKEYEDLTLEEVLAKLENVVETLGEGTCTLEQSFSLYKEGMSLLQEGNARIDRVEKQMLEIGKEGEVHEFSGGM